MTNNLRFKTSKFIDETYRVSFKFNNKTYFGFKGDTLASALLANGIHLVGRSFKYHRPRGIMTSGSEEPNAIIQLHDNSSRTEPNVRATEVEIYEGLVASSQNCWPSVNFDIGGINNLLSPILPAGFYYKTFMWPASFWEKYEYFIRKSAGLGKSPKVADPDIYEHKYIHCDVLVIGAGISGIMAAKMAAKNGFKTLLVDEKSYLGGSSIYDNSEFSKINNQITSSWLEKEINEISKLENLEIKTRTSVAAFHGYNFLLARENLTDHLPINQRENKVRQRLLKIRAKKVITATGSIERPLIFDNNDRPGILLSSAIKKYIDLYGVACGGNNILFTNNDTAYETAMSLIQRGIKINAIIDNREQIDSKISYEVEKNNIEIYKGYTVVDTYGHKRINKIALENNYELIVMPVNYGEIFPATGGLPVNKRSIQRQKYRLQELERWSEFLKVKLNTEPNFFPSRSLLPSLVIISAKLLNYENVMEIAYKIMEGLWIKQLDIDDEKTLISIISKPINLGLAIPTRAFKFAPSIYIKPSTS